MESLDLQNLCKVAEFESATRRCSILWSMSSLFFSLATNSSRLILSQRRLAATLRASPASPEKTVNMMFLRYIWCCQLFDYRKKAGRKQFVFFYSWVFPHLKQVCKDRNALGEVGAYQTSGIHVGLVWLLNWLCGGHRETRCCCVDGGGGFHGYYWRLYFDEWEFLSGSRISGSRRCNFTLELQ